MLRRRHLVRRLTPLAAGGLIASGLTAGLALAGPAYAGPKACDTRVNNTHAKLLECVTLEGVREHQTALQAIADANNGTRVGGSPGYDQSADYAEQVLRDAGYRVTSQVFTYQTFIELSPTVL